MNLSFGQIRTSQNPGGNTADSKHYVLVPSENRGNLPGYYSIPIVCSVSAFYYGIYASTEFIVSYYHSGDWNVANYNNNRTKHKFRNCGTNKVL